MVLEHYANIAEIVGVILVVVTLVFLTLQIRQNTRALRLTTIQTVMQSELAKMPILVENAAGRGAIACFQIMESFSRGGKVMRKTFWRFWMRW